MKKTKFYNKAFSKITNGNLNIKDQPIIVDVLVNHPGYIIGNLITAKYLQKKSNARIIILTNHPFNKQIKEIGKSFGINKYLYTSSFFTPVSVIIKTAYVFIKKSLEIKNRKDVLEISVDNVKIGDLIYDSYLRETGHSTINSLNTKLYKNLFKGIRYYYLYKNYLKIHNFRASVQGHLVYNQFGTLARVLTYHNRTVYAKKFSAGAFTIKACYDYSSVFKYEFRFEPQEFEDFLNSNSLEIDNKVNNFIQNRFSASGRQDDLNIIEAYGKDKIKLSKKDFIDQFAIDPNYPTVCIMSHVFADAPHSNSTMLFDDYYDWLAETLKHIKKVKNVNWLVKPHPANKYYNSKESAEDLYHSLIKEEDNITLLPGNLNTNSLFGVIDIIVTVAGTAGMEFACVGIPSILAGESPYSGHGFTIDPKTKSSYFNMLTEVEQIKPLSNTQIKRAKYYFYLMYIHSRVDCIFIPDMSSAFWIDNDDKEIYKQISNNLTKHQIDDDQFYKNFNLQLKNNNQHLYNH